MSKQERDCSYEEMSKGVGGQSMPSPCHDEPMRNQYENNIPMGEGYNQSGFES